MHDSYVRFIERGYLTKERFFEFGLSETIYGKQDLVADEWRNLKNKIQEKKERVYIRGFGRDGSGTPLLKKFYTKLLENNKIERDATNNAEPTRLIRTITGYSKVKISGYKEISNYQVSHVFGRTKNVYAFAAPWNIVYVPKIMDPFTGHEAKGLMIDEFKYLFQQNCYAKFKAYIDEFNELMSSSAFVKAVDDSLSSLNNSDIKNFEKFKSAMLEDFSPIVI